MVAAGAFPHGGGMDATLPSNPRRAGALWVAATGAFLLLSAAAVFVAVSWDQLPDGLKLAVIAGLTGGFLVGGRWAERTLPATGSVLFHLGAFLVPVDVAAVAVRVELGWRGLVLAEGLLGVLAWAALAHLSSSPLLRRAAMLSVPVTLAGVASLTAAPAPLLVAVAAVLSLGLDRRVEAAVWATLAGLGPLVGTTVASLLALEGMAGTGVLRQLGLAGRPAGLLAAFSGTVAGAVLATEGRRSRDLAYAVPALASVTTSGIVTWMAAEISGRSTLLALPALLLLLEVGSLIAGRDRFWAVPVGRLMIALEVMAAVVFVPVAGVLLLVAPIMEQGFFSSTPLLEPDGAAGVSLAVLALAWLAMGGRRIAAPAGTERPVPIGDRPGADIGVGAALRALADHPAAVPLALISAAVAVELATATVEATALAVLGATAGLALSRRGLGRALVVPAALWAPVVAAEVPALALLVGIGAGLAAAHAAHTQHRLGQSRVAEVILAAAGGLAAVTGCSIATGRLALVPAMAVAVGTVWLVGLVADRASVVAGHGARAVLAVPIVVASFSDAGGFDTPGGPRSLPAALAAAVLLADAIRLAVPAVGYGTAAAGVVGLLLAGHDLGLTVGQTGLVLCLGATVTAGLSALVAPAWRGPLWAATGGAVGVGTLLAASEPRSLMTALVVIGGLIVAVGISEGEAGIGHVGGAVATGGLVGHLLLSGVEASEAYLAPVCLQLLVAGGHARQRRALSSWVAYAPAVGLFGVAAVAERAAGGGSWHAVAAAAVGAGAVGIGGWRRLAGPLFTGTALLVAVTAVDVVASLGQVPAWIWLATTGTALLGVGVALERTDTSPVDAGRRVVEVIAERFE